MSGPAKVSVFSVPEQLADFALRKWTELAWSAVREKGIFNVALSGGGTPVLFYRKLAVYPQPLPWKNTHIFWVDERLVSPESELSNYRLVRESLLERIEIPSDNVHAVATLSGSPDLIAARYEKVIKSHFIVKPGQGPDFDLILLGVGEDGHTASLFPGRPALFEEDRLVVAETLPPAPPPRISLTLPVLNRAAHILFLVSGKNKAPVLKRVIEKKESRLPAARVAPRGGEVIFALDLEATSELSHHQSR